MGYLSAQVESHSIRPTNMSALCPADPAAESPIKVCRILKDLEPDPARIEAEVGSHVLLENVSTWTKDPTH